MVVIDENDYIAHYGILRKSGRYPWGSGGNEDPNLWEKFIPWFKGLRDGGMSETEIAHAYDISTTQLRALKTRAKSEQRASNIAMAQRLKEKGYSNVAGAERMGIPESTYRTLLKPGAEEKASGLQNTAEMLRQQVDRHEVIDIGAGVESHLGISKDRLKHAAALLESEGYGIHRVNVRQQATGKDTNIKVLAKTGIDQKEIWLNPSKIKNIDTFSDDNGKNWARPEHPPIKIDPSRVDVVYGPDGGAKADGVLYVRPGVRDVSIGNNRYAQVRVRVGDDRYLKGMALYKDDLPDGIDILFNTNKESTGNKLEAMKKVLPDDLLPFGTVTRPLLENVGTDDERITSVMNLVNEEGEWAHWSRNISAQALSKQSPSLAKKQLELTYNSREEEFNDIMSMTNPVVRERLLLDFAEGTDAAAVNLKAAGLERQNWNVILPVNSMPENEIYAPGYNNGEEVALIRYPHGGKFEIPRLTVNNRRREARSLLGNAQDAVGIHHSVAEHLSGADFDGDTVLVIPVNRNKRDRIRDAKPLKDLQDFDPKISYPGYEGMPKLTDTRKQHLMGDVSNLITDMTLMGAPNSELARAVRHSMVVIDAEKHDLNYKQSYIDNGIANLKKQYQNTARGGAATLISRAGSPKWVNERREARKSEGGPIDPKTGKRNFVETGKTRTSRSGEAIPKKEKVKKLADTDDAFSLVSDANTTMERVYATHSNRLKSLANKARLNALNSPNLNYSPSARKAYAKEVASLDHKLALANRNRPLERQAQIIAGETIKQRRKANPNLDGDALKKVRFQAQEEARIRTGASKQNVKIDSDEWEAIQSGAVSTTKLKAILDNADMDVIKQHATPRDKKLMTTAKTAQAERLLSAGYTRSEVAARLGVSVSTLDNATSGVFKEG